MCKKMAKLSFRFMIPVAFVLCFSLGFIGCTSMPSSVRDGNTDEFSMELLSNDVPKSAAEERDMIYALAAYSVVFLDWQSPGNNPRGHNIGCIIVAPDGKAVAWNRNSNNVTNNSTQHGEVRAMQDYITSSGHKYLDGYTVYTTLEPCAMCSGMMCLTMVSRCVYGQTDGNYPNKAREYGRAIERLKIDMSTKGGYRPYPRTPDESVRSTLSYAKALDYFFSGGTQSSVTQFLLSEDAQRVYAVAYNHFKGYKVYFSENQKVYDQVAAFLKTVPGFSAAEPESLPAA